MSAGYFPRLLAGLLSILGLAICIGAIAVRVERMNSSPPRGLMAIAFPAFAFAFHGQDARTGAELHLDGSHRQRRQSRGQGKRNPRRGCGAAAISEEPELFWGLIASMWVGNAMLLVINLPLVGIWVKLLKIPYRLMFPAIVLCSCIGVYSVNNSVLDIALAAGFGALGYVLTRLDFEPAPLALGFVLGPLMEESLRRTMLLSRGDPLVFFERPISLTLMGVAAIILVITVVPSIRSSRRAVFSDSED